MKQYYTIITFLILVSCNPQPATRNSQPNVLFILADDMGYGDLACQNPESKIPTPNLDQLASQGMRFTDAHSPSAVCSPTRYGLLTGRYAWRTRLKKHVLWQWEPPLIEAERYTVGRLFQEAGYHTACIGKWHLGWDWPFPDSVKVYPNLPGKLVDYSRAIENGPVTRGFDYYFGDDVPNFQPYTFIENDHVTHIPTIMKPDSLFGGAGLMVPGWRLEEVMLRITEVAVNYIEDHAAKPFFLYFALTAPHTPIAPDSAYLGTSEAGRYGDFVFEVDACVGRVIKALEDNGIEDQTMVLFTSDNGSPARNGENWSGPVGSVRQYGHNPSRPWRGVKADIWEGGHRVPFLVKWPGQVAKGEVRSELICHIDLIRTMAELLHFDLPDGAGPDSKSILSVILGKETTSPVHESLVLHSHHGLFAIRQGHWKLIMGLGPGGFSGQILEPKPGEPEGQLYNLQEDPGEAENLYDQYPDRVEEMLRMLDSIRNAETSRD